MANNVMYERDLLYTTDTIAQPGCIHVEVLNPNKNGRVPVVIESKTSHSPINYISSVIRVMQSDIFDRILIDIKSNVNLYIKPGEEIKSQYGGKNYIKVIFEGEKVSYSGVDITE